MNGQEIYDKCVANRLGSRVRLEKEDCWYRESFETGEGEESHDVAWELYCDIQAMLRNMGLELDVTDGGNMDHDTVWGKVVEYKNEH